MVIAFYGVLIVLRFVAARRLRDGRTNHAWLVFAPMFIVPAAILRAAISLLDSSPIEAGFAASLGIIYGIVLVRMVYGVSQATLSATTAADLADRAVGPMVDFALAATVLSIFVVLVAALLMVIVAYTNGGI
jgi:hypothetical protein